MNDHDIRRKLIVKNTHGNIMFYLFIWFENYSQYKTGNVISKQLHSLGKTTIVHSILMPPRSHDILISTSNK